MKNQKKEFVWYSLRIGFWSLVGMFVLFSLIMFISQTLFSNIFSGFFGALINLVFIILLIFTFIESIIHLTKYKEKALAITVLVLTSIMLLFFLFMIVSSLMPRSVTP